MTGVLVVGAGPVGLALAAELRLGGAEVTVVERRTEASTESRGLGFTARTAELFRQRGLLERFGDAQISTHGHFGGIPFDLSILPGSHFGVRNVAQQRTEAVLETWAREEGAEIRRGVTLIGLRQEEAAVVADLDGPDGPDQVTARWLVGCDGGRSLVRRLAGFAFPGHDATREMFLADVVGRGIRPRFIGEKVQGGMVMAAPLADGVDRIIVCERGAAPGPRQGPPPWSEVADAWQRLTGEDLHDAEVRWVSSFTDASRQVTAYRQGRVLLAGDAAHIHLPAGGQGLSVGVQDAVNLGWKLAAVERGSAPAGLLDSYHDERHPAGEQVLRNTRAQGYLYLNGSEVEPVRGLVSRLMEQPVVARRISGAISGLDLRYGAGSGHPRPGDHPLLGGRLPDIGLGGRADGTRVLDLLTRARGLLITDRRHWQAEAEPWQDRVAIVDARCEPEEAWPDVPDALLVRPDGYVAWAAPGTTGLTDALHRWFGDPFLSSPAPAPVASRRPAYL